VTQPSSREQPNDIEAERSILGSLLLSGSGEAMALVGGSLEPSSFYHPGHRLIYSAAVELSEAAQPIDEVTLSAKLKERSELDKAGGLAYLVGLVDSTPSAANVEHYARIVADRAVGRQLHEITSRIAASVLEPHARSAELVAKAAGELVALASKRETKQATALGVALRRQLQRIEAAAEQGGQLPGIATGFRDLDETTLGWHRGDLVIIAGRPSMGKTAFVQQTATHAAENGSKVLVFSLEMSEAQLAIRSLATRARIDSKRLLRGDVHDCEWSRLQSAVADLFTAPMHVDDTAALTVSEIRAKCVAHKQRHGLDLVVVDYLQLMGSEQRRNAREVEVSAMSRGLKAIAKELNVPVLALSQLNRSLESRPDKRPMLSDLRESGAIEQDADVVQFLYRDEYYNRDTPDQGIAELIIGKQRMGEAPRTIKLRWRAAFTRFADLNGPKQMEIEKL